MILFTQVTEFLRSIFEFLYIRTVTKLPEIEHVDNYDNYIDDYEIVITHDNIMRKLNL